MKDSKGLLLFEGMVEQPEPVVTYFLQHNLVFLGVMLKVVVAARPLYIQTPHTTTYQVCVRNLSVTLVSLLSHPRLTVVVA